MAVVQRDVALHPGWAHRVTTEHAHLLATQPEPRTAARSLLLKRAMTPVAASIRRERASAPPSPRARRRTHSRASGLSSEQWARGGSSRREKRPPFLDPFTDITGRCAAMGRQLWALRQHAHDVAKSILVQYIRDQAARTSEQPPSAQAPRRAELATRLKRRPGSSVRAADGIQASAPADIAATLRDHWARAFATTPTDLMAYGKQTAISTLTEPRPTPQGRPVHFPLQTLRPA